MAEFKRIQISDIDASDRLREVEEEHAVAIAQSMVEHGQITPIMVRPTPANKAGKFKLVAGAHRIRACQLNEDREIDAIIVQADRAEAQLLEISENLFRNDLSVVDRAIFVQTYREVWEQKHGIIRSGPRNQGQLEPNKSACVVDLISDEAEAGFARHVADRLGVSKASAKRLDQISRRLTPDLRRRLRGTPAADNQSLLLKLASKPPEDQGKLVLAIDDGAEPKKALELLNPAAPKADKQAQLLNMLVKTWKSANDQTRQQFVEYLRNKGVIGDDGVETTS